MVGANVDGRPMPRRSSSLMSDASVNRAGGDEDDGRTVAIDAVADLALRKDGFLFLELRRGVVAPLHVGPPEAGKFDRLAARREDGDIVAGPCRGNLDRRSEDT